MRDYYAILGLEHQAGDGDIKKAYRRLAKQLHPDVNPSPDAERRFIEVNEAYAFLSDVSRRRVYQKTAPISDAERIRREAVYKQWVHQQQRKTQQQASHYAQRPIEDFVNSPIFKTAMVLSKLYNYIFLAMGVVMALGPAVHYFQLTPKERHEQNLTPVALWLPLILGGLFTYGIYVFLFKKKSDNDV